VLLHQSCFLSNNSKDDLTDQFPFLRNKFLGYADYADATIKDIFSKEQL
jgi:enediyne biosynthesis protein E4